MDQQSFLSTYGPLASDIASRTHLDPSVVLGQIAQETGWGDHVKGNNIFGISPGGQVATYPTVQDAAQAYVGLINSKYSNASAAPTPLAQARAIGAGGYNPDPTYGDKVATIASSLQQSPAGQVDQGFASKWGIAASPDQDPPPASAPTAPVNVPSEADFASRWGITPQETLTAATPSFPIVPVHPAPDGSGKMTNLSDADYAQFQKQVAGAQNAEPAPVAASSTPANPLQTAASAVGDVLQSANGAFNAGLNRFGHDVTDPAAEALASAGTWAANKAGYPTAFGAPTGVQLQSSDAVARQGFEQQYETNPLAQIPRIGADVAASMVPGGAIGSAVTGAGEALLGTAGWARALASALSGAGQGAAAAGTTAGSSDQPIGQQLAAGAMTGGALGAALPAIGALGAGIRNAAVGGTTPSDVASLAQTARSQYGIPIYGGQISTSPAVRFLDSVSRRMPFSGAQGAYAAQQSAFNNAVASTFGENADAITPEVMARAKTRLGQQFDDVASKTNIQADDQLLSDLGRIQGEAAQTLPASEQVPINSQLTNILNAAVKGEGAIDGETYQALTRKGTPLDRATQSSDPNVRFYAGQVRNALDDAMQRSASPELQAQLSQARSQYKAMKTVEDLVEKSPTGDISPANLLGRVRASYGNMAYDGGGQLGDLARIGQQFLKEPPSSGTAERTLMGGLMLDSPQMLTNPLLLAKIGAGIGASRLAGSALRSNFYTNMLLRNSLGSQVPSPLTRFLSNALQAAPQISAVSRNVLSAPSQ